MLPGPFIFPTGEWEYDFASPSQPGNTYPQAIFQMSSSTRTVGVVPAAGVDLCAIAVSGENAASSVAISGGHPPFTLVSPELEAGCTAGTPA